MRSGADTLDQIEEALKDLKLQEAALQRELEEANAARAGLVAERLQALKTLASIRARNALADGVISDADTLSEQVRAMLAARQRTIAQLTERHSQAERQRQDLLQREATLMAHIAALEARLDRFGTMAREALAATSEYTAAKAAHQALAGMLEKAVAKAGQVASDESEKGLPYRSDPLFMYLWRRQMGTPLYQAGGLARALDEWVARLIRYHDARANYAMLTEIPVRLRAHAADLQRQTEAAKARFDGLEAAKTEELAGPDFMSQLQSAREARTALGKELASVTSELAETGVQLGTYAKGEDQAYQAAVATYAQFLDREPIRKLLAEAAGTETREDDHAAAEVRRIGGGLEQIEAGNPARRRRLDQISDRRAELTSLTSKFRRQRYDDAASTFDDEPRTEDLLQSLLRGAITAIEYWARMQAQQRWHQRPADAWRRQSGTPPFDGFPGGWSGGSGDWGGGGSSGGNSSDRGPDFTTGGTF